jgi:hypothetical protein
MNQPKRVRIALAANLRADWSGVVEVPTDASDEELHALVNQFFHTINMDEYVVNDEHWGKGECELRDNVDAEERVEYRATRDAQGNFVIEKVTSSLWCVVHGEAFVPEVFDSVARAEAFKAQCDDYVSGPWEIATDQA